MGQPQSGYDRILAAVEELKENPGLAKILSEEVGDPTPPPQQLRPLSIVKPGSHAHTLPQSFAEQSENHPLSAFPLIEPPEQPKPGDFESARNSANGLIKMTCAVVGVPTLAAAAFFGYGMLDEKLNGQAREDFCTEKQVQIDEILDTDSLTPAFRAALKEGKINISVQYVAKPGAKPKLKYIPENAAGNPCPVEKKTIDLG